MIADSLQACGSSGVSGLDQPINSGIPECDQTEFNKCLPLATDDLTPGRAAGAESPKMRENRCLKPTPQTGPTFGHSNSTPCLTSRDWKSESSSPVSRT